MAQKTHIAWIVLVGTLLPLALLVAIRAAVPFKSLDPHNDVAFAVFAGLGVIFGVMLAQLVVAGWGDYQAARIASFREAAALHNVVRHADAFTPTQRTQILTLTDQYARALVDEEWPTMRGGSESGHRAEDAIHDLFHCYAGVDTSLERGSPYFDASIHKLEELSDARAERLAAHRSRLPRLVWRTLFIDTAQP